MKPCVVMVLFLAGALSVAAAGTAPTARSGPVCMDCHRPTNIAIDPERFAQSVHHALDCNTCHTDGFDKFPHKAPATLPDCVDCHTGSASPAIDFDEIAGAVKASVHVKIVDPGFRCTNCHSPHYFIPAERMTDVSGAILVFNKICLGCHAAGETPEAKQLAFAKLGEKHGLFPHWQLHLQNNACVSCHTPAEQRTLHLILPKAQAQRDCAQCHDQNSRLVAKLYTFLAVKQRKEQGWTHAILFNTAYLTGASRNKWLDWGTFGFAVFVFLAIAAHAIGRWLFTHFRRLP